MTSKTPPKHTGLRKVSGEFTKKSLKEQSGHERLHQIALAQLPRYGHHWNAHSLVTLTRQSLSRILYYDHLYRQIVDKPGVICEFGVQWGATLAQLIGLRGMYEPFNHSRMIYGFDTFEGFVALDRKDGTQARVHDYSTVRNYEAQLDELLTLHESMSPLSHLKKFALIKGDASITIDTWLAENPHAIVAMAIFDMDVYKPTKMVLEKILPRLTKGSLLVFDELGCQHFPGETAAVDEVLGLNTLALKHFPHQPNCAWAVFGD